MNYRTPYALLSLWLCASLLAACGGASEQPLPTPDTSAAVRLATVFPARPTATPSDVPANPTAQTEQPDGAATSALTATATVEPNQADAARTDPRVRTSCVPLAVGDTAQASAQELLPIDIKVDLTPTGRTISQMIYGVAAADSAYVQDIGATVNRWGGNQVTRHNWEINASNAGADWNFANVPYDWPNGKAGATADAFISNTLAIGASPILTVPAIGYVAKDGDNNTRSANVPSDGGPPLQVGSDAIAGYDPGANQRATSIKSFARKGAPFSYPPDVNDNAVYQDEWINHIVQTFGRAEVGGLAFYAIDNEPDLWASTHRDIHPVLMGYDDMLRTFTEYATAIKGVDSSAQILGPESWGVSGLFFSALDRGSDNYDTHTDRQAHGGLPFIPWFLDSVRKHDQAQGYRTLDVLTVHNYPQSGVYPTGNDPATNALRLRSTQQLWNPDYRDESWVARTEGARLALIPRLRDWIDTYYPATKLGITEWNYGADDTINGGLTIVDVLGIFGREGVDLATYWTFPKPGTPGANAFTLYGNYDTCGRHFGEQVLTTTSSDQQTLAAYGSLDTYSGDVFIMAVNKLPDKSVEARFEIPDLGQRSTEVYQLDADHPAIRRLADVRTDDASLTYTVSPYTATLFVIKP